MGLTVRIVVVPLVTVATMLAVVVVAKDMQSAIYRLTLNANFCFLDWT